MYKNFKISDEERKAILEQHKTAIKKTLNEAEGELKNPYWLKIKRTLETMGFKFSQYNEEGDLHNYLYSGKNPFKDYQHGTLEKGNVLVQYPFTDVEGGAIDTNAIRVFHQTMHMETPQTKKVDAMIMSKYKNSILSPNIPEGSGTSGNGSYMVKVTDINSIIGMVNDLSKVK